METTNKTWYLITLRTTSGDNEKLHNFCFMSTTAAALRNPRNQASLLNRTAVNPSCFAKTLKPRITEWRGKINLDVATCCNLLPMKEILEDGSSLSCCLFVCDASCNSCNSVSLSSDSSSLSVVKASAYCEHRSGTMTSSMAKSSHATFRLLKMTKNILPLAESIYVRSWASSIARFGSMILISTGRKQ